MADTKEQPTADKKVKIKVRFTHQQMVLLERLKQEGKFGQSYEELIPAVFREYVKQTFGLGGL
ncbi:MAG: hypothetical protein QF449_06780 [Alphaproteobacteria bacterium]|nr:hypothetical protein [Alphaproteobacteria bacterium]MDP6588562.1 hypothetical protein [Alphaproteobacteria bacterium]MDP6817731.1 hypothetical protein [Alphaproteobacteria bacterium]